MKIIIIGSMAAGTSVAAKARRNTEDAEIIIYEQGEDTSYSVCGIPYQIGSKKGIIFQFLHNIESLESIQKINH